MASLEPDPNALPILETGPFFEAHPLAHIIYDLEHFRLVAANAAAVERYGYSREELLNLTRLDLLIGSERAIATRLIATKLKSGDLLSQQQTWRERGRDGNVLHSDTRGMTGMYQGRRVRMVVVQDTVRADDFDPASEQGYDLLSAAARLAQVGAWSYELKSSRMFWSEVMREIHEVDRAFECSLEQALNFYQGDSVQIIKRDVQRCIDEGIAFDQELSFLSAKGTARWLRATGEAVSDSAGRIVGLRGALQDITQRKSAEIELQESRMRLAATLRAIPDLWFILDREGRYLEVSSTDHPALAFRWDQVVGKKFMDSTSVPPELIELSVNAMQRLAASGEQQTFSYERSTLLLGRRDFEARLVPMFDGRVLYLTRDVTDQKNAQRKLQGILRAIPDLWFVIDADDRFAEVSSVDDPRLIQPWNDIAGCRFDEVLEGDAGRIGADLIAACRLTGEVQTRKYKTGMVNEEVMRFEARFVPMEAGSVYLLIRDIGAEA